LIIFLVIFSFTRNFHFTAIIYLTPSFNFEILIMKNTFIGENLELNNYAAFKLPDLNIFLENEKTQENFEKLSKADCSGINYYLRSDFTYGSNHFTHKNSYDKKENFTFSSNLFPSIYIVTNNSIILEIKERILLINFESSKITTLINKNNLNEIKIIYTYDENVTVSGIEKSFFRTYVFCIDRFRNLHYFYFEENFIHQKNQMIILHKMPFAGTNIIDMALICLSNKLDSGRYFYFIFLNKDSIKFFITDYHENDLGLILNNLNLKKENKQPLFSTSNNNNENSTINYSNVNKTSNLNSKRDSNIINENNSNYNYSNQILKTNNSNKTEEKLSKESRVSNILRKSIGRFKKNAKRDNIIEFSKIEFSFESHAEIKRIFVNEENEFFYLSFLSDLNLYTLKFQSNISPKSLMEKFKFFNFIKEPENMLVRISRIFGLQGNPVLAGLMKDSQIESIKKKYNNDKLEIESKPNLIFYSFFNIFSKIK